MHNRKACSRLSLFSRYSTLYTSYPFHTHSGCVNSETHACCCSSPVILSTQTLHPCKKGWRADEASPDRAQPSPASTQLGTKKGIPQIMFIFCCTQNPATTGVHPRQKTDRCLTSPVSKIRTITSFMAKKLHLKSTVVHLQGNLIITEKAYLPKATLERKTKVTTFTSAYCFPSPFILLIKLHHL